MNTYGSSADTRKCRRRISTRWKKITDIAFSSTVKASALNSTIETQQQAADDFAVREEGFAAR